MTKSEATRAFKAKEIQIYTDTDNFSLLNEIVYGRADHHKFTEDKHINRYFLKKGTSCEHSDEPFPNPGYPVHPTHSSGAFTPIVKLSEITEDEERPVAKVETKHLRFTVKLRGSNLCIEKTTDGFSTMELIAACMLLENELAKEKAELMSGGTREEVTNN